MSAVQSSAEHVEHDKKKKRKKKNKDRSVETNETDNTCSHSVVGESSIAPDTTEHKSERKKRKQQGEVDDADNHEECGLNISLGTETEGRQKKRKRKHQECDPTEGSSTVSTEIAVPPSTDAERKLKKKRRKHQHDQEVGDDADKRDENGSSNISLETGTERRHKKKKSLNMSETGRRRKKKKGKLEGSLNVAAEIAVPPTTDVQRKVKKRKRKHEHDQEVIDVDQHEEYGSNISPGTEIERTHKKKRKHEECDPFEGSSNVSPEIVITPPTDVERKAKKKKRKHQHDQEVVDTDKHEEYASSNISLGPETVGRRHKKKKGKHRQCDPFEGSLHVSAEIAVPPITDVQPKAKKKKRKHEHGQEVGDDADKHEAERRHKKKKRKHQDCDPFEGSLDVSADTPSTDIEGKKRKERKKKRKEEAFAECSAEAASHEDGSKQKIKKGKQQKQDGVESPNISLESITSPSLAKARSKLKKKKKKKKRDLQQERSDQIPDSSTASVEVDVAAEAERKHKKKKRKEHDRPTEREELVDNPNKDSDTAANHGLLTHSSVSSEDIFCSVRRSRKRRDVVDLVKDGQSRTQHSVSQLLDKASLHGKHKKKKKKSKRKYQPTEDEEVNLTKETNGDLGEMKASAQEAAEQMLSSVSKSQRSSATAADLVDFALESSSNSGKTTQCGTCINPRFRQSHAANKGTCIVMQQSIVDTKRSSTTSLQQSPGTSQQSLFDSPPQSASISSTRQSLRSRHQSLASSQQSVVNTQIGMFNGDDTDGESGDELADKQSAAAHVGGAEKADQADEVQPAEQGDTSKEEERILDENAPWNMRNTMTNADYKNMMQEKAIRLRGDVRYKSGRWTKKEKQRFLSNWNNLKKEYDITDPNTVLGLGCKHMPLDGKRKRRQFLEDTDFSNRLAAGLERTVESVYQKARHDLGTIKTGSRWLTNSECARLRELHREHRGHWPLISDLMNRTEKSLQVWWQKYSSDTVEKVRGFWTEEEEDQLLKAIQEEAGTEELSGVPPRLPWHTISKSFPTKSAQSCRLHWLQTLQAKQKGQHHQTRFHVGARNLYQCICDLKVTDQTEIDWDLVEENMEHVAPRAVLQSRWSSLKRRLVPFHKTKTFPEILELMGKHLVPK